VRVLLEQVYGALIAASAGSQRRRRESVGTVAKSSVQNIDVSTRPPAGRFWCSAHSATYMLLTMLMGGYVPPQSRARRRVSARSAVRLEPLLTVACEEGRTSSTGRFLATCAYMAAVADPHGDRLRDSAAVRGSRAVRDELELRTPGRPSGGWLFCPAAGASGRGADDYRRRRLRQAAIARRRRYIGLVLLIPTLPLVFAGMLGLRPSARLMAVPSLSQHFLITSSV